jgi:hypothetical protein
MTRFMVWLDGFMAREQAFMVSARGYKGAVREAVKLHRNQIQDMISGVYPIINSKSTKFVFHVENMTKGSRNRFMYFVTFGERMGITSIE